MNRVLVTGGAGTIGAAVVRRLLRDPAWEVRVSDQRPAPQWMREGCEVHTGDLRSHDEARAAIAGYVDAYHHRPHQGLAYRTPAEVALTWKDQHDQSIHAA